VQIIVITLVATLYAAGAIDLPVWGLVEERSLPVRLGIGLAVLLAPWGIAAAGMTACRFRWRRTGPNSDKCLFIFATTGSNH